MKDENFISKRFQRGAKHRELFQYFKEHGLSVECDQWVISEKLKAEIAECLKGAKIIASLKEPEKGLFTNEIDRIQEKQPALIAMCYLAQMKEELPDIDPGEYGVSSKAKMLYIHLNATTSFIEMRDRWEKKRWK